MTETRTPTTTTTGSSARRSLDRWLTMWNTDGEIAREICADDFRTPFAVTERDGSTPADTIRTSEDFVRCSPASPTRSTATTAGCSGTSPWAGRSRAASTCPTRRGRPGPTRVVGRRPAEHAELTEHAELMGERT